MKHVAKQVAVVGAGNWGQNLVRVFHELGALAAVAETSPFLRERLAAEYPEVWIADSYHAIMASEIPAVVIATPAATHYRLARTALERGKDVFLEKPMALSFPEANELEALARETGRVLMVGHLLLYQPAIPWIRGYVASGELGVLHSIHLKRVQPGRVRSAENALWSLGVHDVAVLLHLTGERPLRIKATGQRALQADVEDDVHVHFVFPAGVHAHLHVSWLWPQTERQMMLIGSRGMLEFREREQTVILHRTSVREDLSFHKGESEVLFCESRPPLQAEAAHFLHCIQTRQTPLSDGSAGVEVIRVLEQATRVMREEEAG